MKISTVCAWLGRNLCSLVRTASTLIDAKISTQFKKQKKRRIMLMAIRTGNTSIKAMMEGKTKVEKPELVGVKTQILDIVKGISSENGVFVYVFFAGNKYASIPAANIEEFAAYCDDADDLAEIRSGAYDIIYNKTVSKKGRDYYTCYLEKH